ncbi:sarcosine oxidase subunit gamma family protein [uncultured Tateyamaria sp.]|uniref:sarcosine oxidase subunit gamma n=1 Tax=Tateyamaria sp. 1078 TaxID=3417464 RepID=UPI002615A6BC|nr:sarcosine oxidase subunit gamma family protein [uncultured Tateyamaria sp.]
MAEAVTALGGVAADDGIARITEGGLQGMITLRGDLANTSIKNAATGVAAVDMPAQGKANCVEDRGIAWMSPDEVLVLCPYEAVDANLAKMHATLGETFALAVDVSDARAVFLVEGAQAREVMAKLAPVDLSPEAFTPGMFRRTRLAQVPAAFWMRDATTFQIVCFRSHAAYVFDLLRTAAAPGSAVDFFTE